MADRTMSVPTPVAPQTADVAGKLETVAVITEMTRRSDFIAMVRGQITEQCQRIIDATPAGSAPVVTDANAVQLVNTVVAAMNLAVEGDPVNMIRRNAETGVSATRVVENGVPVWRYSDGSLDYAPTLDWTKVFDPTA